MRYGTRRAFVSQVTRRPRVGGFGIAGLVLALVAALSWALGASPAAAQTAGEVLAWGANDVGQLGTGSTGGSSDVPVQSALPAGVAVTSVAGGLAHSLALTSAGGVVAWGGNSSGQLGTGNNQNSAIPASVQIPSGTFITAIAAGDNHSLALTSTGGLLAWGDNAAGQLGNPTVAGPPTTNVPVDVALPQGVTVTAVAAGGEHSLAVTSTGGALAWGSNDFGELGNGTSGNESLTPVAVSLPAGTAVTSVTAGESHSVARTATGGALAWGQNDQGQLGNGTDDDSDVPVPVSLPSGSAVTKVASGALANHTLALTSAGQVLAWGANQDGQLGNGNTIGSDVPVQTDLPTGTTATAIAAAGLHSVARTASGQALAWGDNGEGQTGNGTTGGSTQIPALVTLPANATVTDVAAGLNQNLAIGPFGAVPGPNGGDGTSATTGPGRATIVGTGLVALALAMWAASAIRRSRRHSIRPRLSAAARS